MQEPPAEWFTSLRTACQEGMSSHIPPELNAELNDDPFYRQCCITGRTPAREKIDRHHNLQFAGKQAQLKAAILPLARSVHDKASHPEVKARCDWVMTSRMTEEELDRYSKVTDWRRRRDNLIARFGPWAPGILPPPLPAGVLA